ncbi:hypothetical protein [Kitasatospora sp. McL0602]|uniref:hypothetical protein n=1 Tax=Kitasatospora sp. McL0602 TaxID=3439530 RepID=UPI003F8CD1B7
MSEEAVERRRPWRSRRWTRVAGPALVVVGGLGAVLALQGPATVAKPLPPAVSTAPGAAASASPSLSPSPSPSPSPSVTPSASPSPSLSPSEEPSTAEPTPQHTVGHAPSPTRTKRRTEISPVPCTACDPGTPKSDCIRVPDGGLVCGPVQSGIPMPNPSVPRPTFTPETVQPVYPQL